MSTRIHPGISNNDLDFLLRAGPDNMTSVYYEGDSPQQDAMIRSEQIDGGIIRLTATSRNGTVSAKVTSAELAYSTDMRTYLSVVITSLISRLHHMTWADGIIVEKMPDTAAEIRDRNRTQSRMVKRRA